MIDIVADEIATEAETRTRSEVVAQNLDPPPKTATARNAPAREVLVIGNEVIKTGNDLDPRNGIVDTDPDLGRQRTGNLATPIPTQVVAGRTTTN